VPTWLVVGSNPEGVAVTDARGAFTLSNLEEGSASLEAYAPDLGRGRADGVKVVAGRTTDRVRIVIAGDVAGKPAGPARAAEATGGVAVTLGETSSPPDVVIVSVVEASEAERAGLAPGDVLVDVDGAGVRTMEDARGRLSGPVEQDVLMHVRRGDRTIALRVPREPVRR
jgi:S1-C subfamily serine protease